MSREFLIVVKSGVAKHQSALLFLGFMLVALCVILFPLFRKSTVLLNANHLVAFYNPWAASPEYGWGMNVHHKPVANDDLWIFYPQRTFTTDSFMRFGEIPFWNPLSFAGNHHAGLSETAVFYPFNLLFFMLPQVAAWTILTVMQPMAVGLGMFLFLRRIIHKSLSAAFGAFVFAFSSLLLVRMIEGVSVGHTLMWMPYALWSIEAYVQTRKMRYPVMVTIVLVFSLTAGWFQYTAYIAALGALYAVWRFFKRQTGDCVKGNWIWLIILPFVFFPLLALFHILPVLQALWESPRGTQRDLGVLLIHLAPFQHLVTVLFPDFWGNPATFNYFGRMPYKEPLVSIGIIPLVLALVGMGRWRKNPWVRFFSIILVGSLVLGTDTVVARFIVQVPVPIVSTFIPARIFILAVFALSVCAAFGFDSVRNAQKRHSTVLLRCAFLVFMLCVVIAGVVWAVYVWSLRGEAIPTAVRTLLMVGKLEHLRTQARNTLLPTFLVGVFAAVCALCCRLRMRRGMIIALWFFTALQVWFHAGKYLPFSDKSNVYPAHPLFSTLGSRLGFNRFITVGSGHIATNIPLQFRLSSPEGVGSMYVRRYGELWSYVTDPEHRIDQLSRIEVYLDPPADRLLSGSDWAMQRLLRLAGVRYLAALSEDTKKIATMAASYRLAWSKGDWQLWEDTETLPRTFVTGDFLVTTSALSILNGIFTAAAPLRRVVIEQDPGIAPDPTATGSATIVRYTPNTVTIRAESDRAALVYLSDTFSSAFRVTVDGQSKPLLRANYAFRAVVIPKGVHTIIMAYATDVWRIGTILSLFFWITGMVLLVVLVRNKRV